MAMVTFRFGTASQFLDESPKGEPMQISGFSEEPQSSPFPSVERLKQEHSLYDRRLETLRAKLMLSEAEKIEEVKLKKLKLRLKDEMEWLLHHPATFSQNS